MTLTVVGISLVFTTLAASLDVALVIGASARARAQTAADAAALAAIAESGPWGRGLAAAEARRYAELNGATLTECLCERGATAVEVEVSVNGASARARAVFEPDRLEPTTVGANLDGLYPVMAVAVGNLLRAAGGLLRVTSGYRSPAVQQILWAEALKRYGSAELADDWVARPGRSMHEAGLAVDLAGDLELAVRLIEDLGLPLRRTLPKEPWHFEFASDLATTMPRF